MAVVKKQAVKGSKDTTRLSNRFLSTSKTMSYNSQESSVLFLTLKPNGVSDNSSKVIHRGFPCFIDPASHCDRQCIPNSPRRTAYCMISSLLALLQLPSTAIGNNQHYSY